MKGKNLAKVAIIILVAIILGILDMPPAMKAPYVSWAPDFIKNQQVHLGLDLQGGSELDYKIDLRSVPEADRNGIIDGVREVINRRVNSLGVSEPNIFISDIAGESHIIVDLAGVDIEEAKKTIGKTIQLEFKEKKDAIDPNEKSAIEKNANNTLKKIKDGADFTTTGREEELAAPGKVTYSESEWKFKDEVNPSLAENLFALKKGDVYEGTVESKGEYTVTPEGQFVEMSGLNILKSLDEQTVERTITKQRAVDVSHILVAFKGAERADAAITRTKEEAKTRADEALGKLKSGGKFDELAKEYSDDPGSKDTGGALGSPAGEGQYTPTFESAALALTEKDQLTDLVESPFGYHIIKATNITPASETKQNEQQIKFAKIFYSTVPDQWQDTGLTGQHFKHADVQFNQVYLPYVAISFNDEGGKKFAEITERNVNKPLAIFVGGDMISAPNVKQKITGGQAVIEGDFSLEEATNLARDLNTGAIPAPIVLAGQYTIGASLGQDALVKSLWAGLIGIIAVAFFMIVYYRLLGLTAVVALGVYSAILMFLIQSQLHTFVAVIIAIGMFVYLMLKILNAKENGWEKLLSSILAVFALFFIVFILANPIVLTLAGVAGVILSIGMAVDANILIFERMKEEMRAGHPLSAAIDIGFDRAWNSIRDSNFSSLITCAILFYFGSSIIQGFAFNLAAGILVSMFTAITITKSLLKLFVGTRLANNLFLYNAKPKPVKKPYKFIEKTKIWFSFSGILIAIAAVSLFAWGLKGGIDFTGGTFMQIKFEKEVKSDELKVALEEIGKSISEKGITKPAENATTPTETTTAETGTTDTTITKPESTPVLTSGSENIDFSNATIIESSDGLILKTKYMSNEVHDEIINKLKEKFGNLTEPKFTTIGATVGDTMKYKATMAIIFSLLAIVIYIAFAFRKIPRNLSPWRFGICAIIALAHDIFIVIGAFALFGFLFNVEVDALFITALLTILGFSVHDTIVVFDRIRENLKHMNRENTLTEVVNQALTQTVARSINTSLSTLLTLLALLIFGSSTLFWFVLALVIGITIGTYSSIFIASMLLVWWDKKAKKA